jgi:rhodanese-related sulfurtransferase
MIQQISVRVLAQELAAGKVVYLIDVRQPWEHKLASLAESVLIPLGELASRIHEVKPPAGAKLVTYCHHGVRSMTAAGILARNGFDQVFSLAGGIDAWSREIDAGVQRY